MNSNNNYNFDPITGQPIQPQTNIGDTQQQFTNQNTNNINQPQNTNQPEFNTQQSQNLYQSTMNPQYPQNNYQPIINNETNQQPKKKKPPIIVIIILITIIIGVIAFLLLNKKEDNSSTDDEKPSNNPTINLNYYDNDRKLKETYTFENAISKFAFRINDSTLIFKATDKIVLNSLTPGFDSYTIDDIIFFHYIDEDYIISDSMYLGVSNSKTLDEFIKNFNNGILNNEETYTIENTTIDIIQSNKDYVFAYLIDDSNGYEAHHYYLAQKLGDKIYYGHNCIYDKAYDSDEISILLTALKEFMSCFSIDDGKEPYLYDKIMNIPIVLNKRIKDVHQISYIYNYYNLYKHININPIELETISDYSFKLNYDAEEDYKYYDWTKDFNENIKYFTEYETYYFGIKEKDNIQIFEIYNYSEEPLKITNIKDFNDIVDKYLINE